MITLSSLAGSWRLSRTIEDRKANLMGRLEGRSVWQPDTNGLKQVETGLLNYGSAPAMHASRSYLWRSEAGELHVLFEDGRPFHVVPRHGGEALHDCPPDVYRVTYEVDGPDAFRTRWHVTGPRKDAIILSTFRRERG